jgi:hypothetical protein
MHTTLSDLPQPVLHDILERLPSSAKAVRLMGVCKALAAAVRALPKVSVTMKLDLTLPLAEPRRRYRTRQTAVEGTLVTRPYGSQPHGHHSGDCQCCLRSASPVMQQTCATHKV